MIKKLKVRNLKAIKNFDAEFEGTVYLFKGENDLGKSTLLKAIVTLLTGERGYNLLSKGEKDGEVTAQIGEYEVSLRFTEDNPRGKLTFERDGIKTEKISALQQIFGYQAFDASEFVLLGETAEGRRKQVEIIKGLFPIEVKERLKAIDEQYKTVYDERTTTNTLYKNAVQNQNQYKFYKDVERISVEDLMKELANANEKNRAYDKNQQAYAEIVRYIGSRPLETLQEAAKVKGDEISNQIAELESKIMALRNTLKSQSEATEKAAHEIVEKLTSYKTRKAAAEKWFEENKPIKIEEIEQKIKDAETINRDAEKAELYKSALEVAEQHSKKSEEQTAILTELLDEKFSLISSNTLIDGLSFDDTGLIFNGIPFRKDDVSTSQEMEVVTKLMIALNPKTKVFTIARGESLGSKRLKALVDFAKANGFQGFIEEMVRGKESIEVSEYTEQ